MGKFPTQMSAEIQIPEDGFTVDDLRSHMRSAKIPMDSRLSPAVVRDVPDPERPHVTTDQQFRLVAKWMAE